LTCSIKLRRDKYVTADTNITVVDDPGNGPTLILGSGYGWTGTQPQDIDAAQLEMLFDAIQDTAERFFPAAYKVARNDGTLQDSRRWCVRPWTSTNLGIFEALPTAKGGKLIVTGGHNTGGFAQAPAVAEAVLAEIRGAAHPMHARYDPRRLEYDQGRIPTDRLADGTR
jgi:glycine/D-amino acid oxidase-like deaminating enzyme